MTKPERMSAEELNAMLASCCECAHYPNLDRCPACEARSHIAALEAELAEARAQLREQELSGALKVNADVIAMILSEHGISESSYIAVQIANALDPPDTPRYDPAQVHRLYLALDETSGGLTHEARRRIAEFKACAGMARAQEREACEAACEQVKRDFLSPEYAAHQPAGSVTERFAVDQCIAAIRARKEA